MDLEDADGKDGGLTHEAKGEIGCDDEVLRIRRWDKVREQFSHHQDGIARINHGSFGSCPSSVQKVQALWAGKWTSQPDAFYFGPLEEGLLVARKAVAEVVNAGSVEELVLVDNVTVAASIIGLDTAWAFLEGRYHKGDAVLMLNCAYGAVKKCLKGYAVRAGAQVLEVMVPLPVTSPQEIISNFESVLQGARDEGVAIRLAIIDHVASMPTLVLPVKELVSLCRKYGVGQVFVDGAHAIGTVEIDVQEINADYYASNLHKWLFAPTSAAFLHCKSQHLQRLHHPVVSHNHGKGLGLECNWTGTKDYSPLLAVPAAVGFVKDELGGIAFVRKENHKCVIEMAQMLAKAWGTHLGAPPEMYASMAMVALPPSVRVNSEDEAIKLRTRLREEFKVEVPIFHAGDHLLPAQGTQPGRSTGYARISYQLYNTKEEYNRFGDAIMGISKEFTAAVSDYDMT